MWPHHAELLSAEDWTTLSVAAASPTAQAPSVLDPVGQDKDSMLASLLIIYWTMRVVHLGLQISKDVGPLKGATRITAIFDAIMTRLDDSTPQLVVDKVREIVEALSDR